MGVGQSAAPLQVSPGDWRAKLLWSSPETTLDWQSYCAVLASTRDHTHLTLKVRTASGSGVLFVDSLVSVTSCN